jgi:hypothetical protein
MRHPIANTARESVRLLEYVLVMTCYVRQITGGVCGLSTHPKSVVVGLRMCQ